MMNSRKGVFCCLSLLLLCITNLYRFWLPYDENIGLLVEVSRALIMNSLTEGLSNQPLSGLASMHSRWLNCHCNQFESPESPEKHKSCFRKAVIQNSRLYRNKCVDILTITLSCELKPLITVRSPP